MATLDYKRLGPPGVPRSGRAGERSIVTQLKDPHNFDSDITPSDLRQDQYRPTQREREHVEFFDKKFKEAQEAQRKHHEEWFNSWTFYRGEHWRAWSRQLNRWMDVRPGPNMAGYDPYRCSRTYNRIEPLIDKNKAKLLKLDLGAVISPMTGRPEDIGATREFRSVFNHCKRANNETALMDEMMDWSATVAAPCLYAWWDKRKPAVLPVIDAQGSLVDAVKRKNLGDVNLQVISPFEWLGDPKAKRFEQMQRVFISQVVPLDYVRNNFKLGKYVEPDAYMGDESGVEARMSLITGDAQRNQQGKPNGVLLKTMWEKSTPDLYLLGRYIVQAGGIELEYMESWPGYPEEDSGEIFPLVPFYYKKSVASIYGRNAVAPLRDAQILYNKAKNKEEEWMDASTFFIVMEKGVEAGADAFEIQRDSLATKVYVKPGRSRDIQFKETPPMPATMTEISTEADAFMRDHIGEHEENAGPSRPGVDSGVAIQLLQAADDTQLEPVRKLIADFWRQVAEAILPIARKNYLEPRLAMMQDSMQLKPDDVRTEILWFQHLAAGRIVISAGNSTQDSPILREQKINDMAGKGMFTPEAMPITLALLKARAIELSDKVDDDLITALEQAMLAQQQSQPDPAQLEAQQQAHEQQVIQMQNDAKIELATAIEKLRTEREAESIRLKSLAEQQLAELKLENDGKLAILESHLEQMNAQFQDIKISLTGKMDPTAIASLEKERGLDVPPAETVKKLTEAPAIAAAKPVAINKTKTRGK